VLKFEGSLLTFSRAVDGGKDSQGFQKSGGRSAQIIHAAVGGKVCEEQVRIWWANGSRWARFAAAGERGSRLLWCFEVNTFLSQGSVLLLLVISALDLRTFCLEYMSNEGFEAFGNMLRTPREFTETSKSVTNLYRYFL
jgi:hypothetical protein